MRSRSSRDAAAMLFQLAASPVQRRRLRYTFAPHEAAITALSPPHPPQPPHLASVCHLFSIRASTLLAVLMFCIKQIVDASPSAPVKAIRQIGLRGFSWPSSPLSWSSFMALVPAGNSTTGPFSYSRPLIYLFCDWSSSITPFELHRHHIQHVKIYLDFFLMFFYIDVVIHCIYQ